MCISDLLGKECCKKIYLPLEMVNGKCITIIADTHQLENFGYGKNF